MMAAVRRFQQSYFGQLLIAAFITAATAALGALLASSKGDLSNLGAGSFETALGIGGAAGMTYLLGVMQHSPGSASFKADGTPNKAVTDLVTLQQAVPTSSLALEVALRRLR